MNWRNRFASRWCPNIQEMLDRQKSIRGATEAVASHLDTNNREVQLRVKQLAPAETAVVRICADTLELINQTQFSVALPPALEEIKSNCSSIADRLDTGNADVPLVDDQKQVEQDLQNLLDTFKQLASAQGECKGGNCKGDKNKLLAELKTLRLLQTQVTVHTNKVDVQRAAAGDQSPAMQEKITGVRDEQQNVHRAVEKLQAELAG